MTEHRSWHEEDHPRDREGKFTFKNGGDYSLGDETDYISLLLNLLKSNFLSDKYKTQIINNINKHTISSDNNNSNNNIKFEKYNLKSSNTRNNNKSTRENNTNSIDKINNPNKLKLGFGVLQPKKQKNIEDILYPTMNDEEPVIKNNRYKGIELLDNSNIKERPIEDILYPTMNNIKKVEIPRKNAGDYETVGKYLNKFQEDEDTNEPGSWIAPCIGEVVGHYGEPREDHIHNGIDIVVPVGTPVKVIADGKVIAVGPAGGYGRWVVVDHGIINGKQVTSEYGHIIFSDMKIGQVVKQGDIIARSGNEGYSHGPHVHITIREGKFPNGRAVNPYKYIDKRYLESR